MLGFIMSFKKEIVGRQVFLLVSILGAFKNEHIT